MNETYARFSSSLTDGMDIFHQQFTNLLKYGIRLPVCRFFWLLFPIFSQQPTDQRRRIISRMHRGVSKRAKTAARDRLYNYST